MMPVANLLANGGYIDPRALTPTALPEVRPRLVELPAGGVLNGIDFRY
jgi:hypothetical protein